MPRYKIDRRTALAQSLLKVSSRGSRGWDNRADGLIAHTTKVMTLQMIDSSEAALTNIASKILIGDMFRHEGRFVGGGRPASYT